jgi:hypothetical protein
MMNRGVDINDLILLVESQDFIAILVLKQRLAVIDLLKAAENSVKSQYILTLGKPIKHHVVKQAHGSIPDKALDNLREFADQVTGRDASDRAAINSNLALNLQLVDQELNYSLSVNLLLIRSEIWRENRLLRLTISPIVPDQHVAVSAEEEVQPVSVGRGDHPLVDQSVGITHNYRRLEKILFLML